MSYVNRSAFRAVLMAASAMTLMGAAVPTAFAAAQNSVKAETAVLVKIAQNDTSKRDRPRKDRNARNENRRDNRAENRRNRRADDRAENRRDRRAENRAENRRDRRTNNRRDSRRHANRHNSGRHHNGHRSQHHVRPRNHVRQSPPRYTRPARHARRHNYGHQNRHRGHRTSYRSGLGISFHFGSPGYSQYRWAPAAYSFYRPSYGHYNTYQRRTTCRRVTIDGWHHGHRELVSVKQCSNPWDGTYIVQGSERIIACPW